MRLYNVLDFGYGVVISRFSWLHYSKVMYFLNLPDCCTCSITCLYTNIYTLLMIIDLNLIVFIFYPQ